VSADRVAFFRDLLARYEADEPLERCSCCDLPITTCTYDKDVAAILSKEFGVTVPLSYVQSAEYWVDQSRWEANR